MAGRLRAIIRGLLERSGYTIHSKGAPTCPAQPSIPLDEALSGATPQNEEHDPVTDLLMGRLGDVDTQRLTAAVEDVDDPGFRLPDEPIERKRELLRFGTHLFPDVVSAKTGLFNLKPPEGVHNMQGHLEIDCGSLYYADLVCEAMMHAGRRFDEGMNYLDFGCSSGRVVRVLAQAFPKCGWFGCDPIPAPIIWASQKLPNVRFYRSPQVSPLAYDSDFFSMVYAISVWSHFSERAALSWFGEMHRVIKPRGLLVFSTHGLHTLKLYRREGLRSVQEIRVLVGNLIKTGYAFEDVFGEAGDHGLDCVDWGSCYVSTDWVLRKLLGQWKLVHYDLGRSEQNQDVYVLEKR